MPRKPIISAALITGVAMTGANAHERSTDIISDTNDIITTSEIMDQDIMIYKGPADLSDELFLGTGDDVHVDLDEWDAGVELTQTLYGGVPDGDSLMERHRKGNITLDNGIKKGGNITLDNGIKRQGKVKLDTTGRKTRRTRRGGLRKRK